MTIQSNKTDKTEQSVSTQSLSDMPHFVNLRDLDNQLSKVDQIARGAFENRYRFVRKLGDGMSGDVEEYVDLESNGHFAKKEVSFVQSGSRLFLRELRCLKRANDSKYIVGIQSAYVIDGTCGVILIDLCKCDLRTFYRSVEDKKIEVDAGWEKTLARHLLLGIKHIHGLQIMHRDIKPQNLLITEKGVLQLADFGLAKDFGDSADPWKRVNPYNGNPIMTSKFGTMWYLAPEMVMGAHNYHCSVDMWSAGLVILEMFLYEPFCTGFKTDSLEGCQTLMYFYEGMFGKFEEESWPGVTQLPHYRNNEVIHKRSDIREMFKCWSENRLTNDVLDLIECIMTPDPFKRMRANHALQHYCFSTSILPTEKVHASSLNSWNEPRFYSTKKIIRSSRGKKRRFTE